MVLKTKLILNSFQAEDAANQAAEVKMKKYTTTHNMTTSPKVKFFIGNQSISCKHEKIQITTNYPKAIFTNS